MEGRVRSAVGGATGDTGEQVKGKAQEIKGRVKQAVGKAKQRVDPNPGVDQPQASSDVAVTAGPGADREAMPSRLTSGLSEAHRSLPAALRLGAEATSLRLLRFHRSCRRV